MGRMPIRLKMTGHQPAARPSPVSYTHLRNSKRQVELLYSSVEAKKPKYGLPIQRVSLYSNWKANGCPRAAAKTLICLLYTSDQPI